MTNEAYISQHLKDDIRQLALKRAPEGVDAKWCLQQIEGWQLAQKKLPKWSETEGLWYPPKLSMEQCSSELTALYKREQIERLFTKTEERKKMIDLTGGYGVDFSYITPVFEQATYVEKLSHLCDIANHNLPLLGLRNADIICKETTPENLETLLAQIGTQSADNQNISLVFLDPARRDNVGRKTVAIEDCTPDVVTLQDQLLEKAQFVMLKLSPMLDISMALRSLKNVCEVHIVSVHGECKELLIIMSKHASGRTYYCTNLDSSDKPFVCDEQMQSTHPCSYAQEPQQFIYEPNASILKAGVQDIVASQLKISKLHPNSNLFTNNEVVKDFPGRIFKIVDWSTFGKQEIKRILSDLKQANLTIRNFPTTVAELRKKLKLKEGGSTYLFATTLASNTRVLIKCEKVNNP